MEKFLKINKEGCNSIKKTRTYDFTKERKSTPLKFSKETEEKSISSKFSDRFPIYWIRSLQSLIEQKLIHEEYIKDPKRFESYDGSDEKYYKVEGLGQEQLNIELSNKVHRTSNIDTREFNDLLEHMLNERAPYLTYSKCKEDGKLRYRIPILGEMAIQRMQEDKVLSGFWDVLARTQPPKPKHTSSEFLRRFTLRGKK